MFETYLREFEIFQIFDILQCFLFDVEFTILSKHSMNNIYSSLHMADLVNIGQSKTSFFSHN